MKKEKIIVFMIFYTLLSIQGYSTVRISCPSSIDLGCNPKKIEIPKPNQIETDSDCNPVKVKIISQISSIDPETCGTEIAVTYQAEDKCGDIAVCTVTIIYTEDSDPPVFDVCPNGNIGCINSLDDLDDPTSFGMKISDNCGVLELSKTFQQIHQTGPCTYQAQQQWEATDQCGNTSGCFTVVSYNLSINPLVITSCPADTFLGCSTQGIQIPPADLNSVQFQGGCEAKVASEFYDLHLDSCLSYIIRYYIVTDLCGNADTCSQKISWSSDNVAPVFTSNLLEIDLGCNPTIDWKKLEDEMGTPTAIDNCSETIVSFLGKTSSQQGCKREVLYQWEAKDICGNISIAQEKVSWTVDTISPVFYYCPPDIDYGVVNERPDLTNLHNGISYLAYDNCSTGVIAGIQMESLEEAGPLFRKIYTWKATDDCGNEAICRQNVTYTYDESAPIITSCPPDTNFGCVNAEFILPPPDLSRFKYEDETAVTAKVSPDQIIGVIGCTYTIKRVYTATDEAGNLSFCEQFIQYTPEIVPTWDYCPKDIYLGCHPDTGLFNLTRNDIPMASSACGAVTIIKKLETINSGNDCEDSMFQQWEATDSCGNTITCSRTIRWSVDRVGPIVLTPNEIVNLGCRTNPLPPETEVPQVNIQVLDNCNYTTEYLGYTDENFFCSHKRVYTWRITDLCGSTEFYKKIINYTLDTRAPIITACPPDYEYSCIGGDCSELPGAFLSQVKYEDDCDVTITKIKHDLSEEECKLTYTYYYVAKDQCGNTDTCTQKITMWRDSFPPVFTSIPSNVFLGCGGNPNLVPIPLVEAEDCSEFRVERLPDEFRTDGCRKEVIQKWRAIDRWGNRDFVSRSIIYIDDTNAPVITHCPPDTNIGPVNVYLNIPDLRHLIKYEDNCSATVGVLNDSLFSIDNCVQGVKRTYIISDECGNKSYCTQNFYFTPIVNPLSWDYCPGDVDLGCNTNPDFVVLARNDEPVLNSNCGDAVINKEIDEEIVDGCKTTIHQKWTANDNFGNTIECRRTISFIHDTEAPLIEECPEGIAFGCVENFPQLPEFNPNDLILSDNCGNLTYSYHDESGSLSNCSRIVRRTIIVEDACGNRDVCTQDFTWTFIEDPFEDYPYPEDLTIICGEVPPAQEYEMRNCGIGIPILSEEIIIGECLSGNCTVIRIWAKEDCIGLRDGRTQIITLACDDFLSSREDIQTRNIENFHEGIKDKIEVYPNPGVNKINIEMVLTKESPYHIILRNVSGKIIKEVVRTDNYSKILESISTSMLPEGIYFVDVRAKDYRSVSKWIKSN